MHDYVIVDAFTNRPFAGNPAGVIVLDGPVAERWMQAVATELNLSETAYLRRLDDGAWGLRWFTPVAEVDLCGHATLAAAHALWREGHEADAAIRFQTASGTLVARGHDGGIELDFPSLPADPVAPPPTLDRILGGATWRWFGQTRHADPRAGNLLVEMENEDAVRALAPDLAELGKLPVGGLIVTARAESPGFDFVSRYFAPAGGIPEDPVTGSAHCTSGPFWSERLGKDELRACQLSRRCGELGVRVTPERVFLLGEAVTVARGAIVSP